MDSDGHARDVADPYRSRECGSECLEVRDVAWFVRVVILAGRDSEAVRELAHLDEAQPQREEDPGA